MENNTKTTKQSLSKIKEAYQNLSKACGDFSKKDSNTIITICLDSMLVNNGNCIEEINRLKTLGI